MMWLIVAGAALGVFALLCVAIGLFLPKRIGCDFRNKHVFITGGSKGIGKEIAAEALRRGCKLVSIAARNKGSLEEAATELKTLCGDGQSVKWFQLDVSQGYEEIAWVVQDAVEECGPVDVLINNAGCVAQGGFIDLDVGAFEEQLKTNYLSAVYTTRAVIDGMRERRYGHVGFVSSAAGQCAIWGYTAYSPSKFAIRGFAEALHMELLPFNIGVSILFPPNTQTEGFQEELKGMPEEVREISDSAGVFSPRDVARTFVSNIASGEFTTTVGLEGWMLGVLTAGAAPEPNTPKAIVQVLLAGILRAVMLFYISSFNSIVERCHRRRGNK